MKKNSAWSTYFLILMLIIGLSLLLYPSFSEWWNERFQAKAINTYTEMVSKIDDDKYAELWESAQQYNSSLLNRENGFVLTEEQKEAYNNELNLDGSGVMGYIEIPSINVTLSLYHTTADPILSVAIGHVEWTSLPTGGESTHCVVSGHRGLPSARLFTDLDKMQVGDLFMLNILDEVLTYEVDQIKIVLPHETEDLLIQPGKDLVTLVTCTPYGVNSHRLFVRGVRTDNAPEAVERRVTADALYVDPMPVAGALLGPCVLVGILGMLTVDGVVNALRKRKNQ